MASALVKVALVGAPGKPARPSFLPNNLSLDANAVVSAKTELCLALAALRDPVAAVNLLQSMNVDPGGHSNDRSSQLTFSQAKVLVTADCTPAAVHLFDTSGGEGSDPVLRTALSGAHCVLICIEVDSLADGGAVSRDVAAWKQLAKRHAQPAIKSMKVPIVLVALRTEKRYDSGTRSPKLNYSQGLAIACKLKLPYAEVSVVESPVADVLHLFEDVVRLGLRYLKPKDVLKVSIKEETSRMSDYRSRIKELQRAARAAEKERSTVEKAEAKEKVKLVRKESKALKKLDRQPSLQQQRQQRSPVAAAAATSSATSSPAQHIPGSHSRSGSTGAASFPSSSTMTLGSPQLYATLDGGGPLPPGWEMRKDPKNFWYYIDHVGKRSTYVDPRDSLGPLPAHFEQRLDNQGKQYFVDHSAKTSTYTDPRLNYAASGAHAVHASAPPNPQYAAAPSRQTSVDSPAYRQAPSHSDSSARSYVDLLGGEIDVKSNMTDLVAKATAAGKTTLAYENYAEAEVRFLSFHQNTSNGVWPHTQPSPEQCVAAGLFFMPQAAFPDRTKCYVCGVQIQKWLLGDDPLIIHAKLSSDCPFVSICHQLGQRDTARVPKISKTALSALVQKPPESAAAAASGLAPRRKLSSAVKPVKKSSDAQAKLVQREDEIRFLQRQLAETELRAQQQIQAEKELALRKQEAQLSSLHQNALMEAQQRQHEIRQVESERQSLEAWKTAQQEEREQMRRERKKMQQEAERLRVSLAEAECAAAEARRAASSVVRDTAPPDLIASTRHSGRSANSPSADPVRRNTIEDDLQRRIVENAQRYAAKHSASCAGPGAVASPNYAQAPGGRATPSRQNIAAYSFPANDKVGSPILNLNLNSAAGEHTSGYQSMPGHTPSMSRGDVTSWTVSDVFDWMCGIDFGSGDTVANATYAQLFRENSISGRALLELSSNDLRDELGIKSLGHRKMILSAVAEVSRPSTVIAQMHSSTISANRELSQDAVSSLTIQWSDIKLGKAIGEGASGIVHKADYRGRVVAVKLLKMQSFDTSVMKELLLEATIMQQLQNQECENIVKMFGMCLTPPNVAIITEFYDNGCLLDRFDTITGWNDVFWLAYGVSNGMAYMHEHDIVHRDLAARNVLLGTNSDGKLIPCVSDFGMSRYTVSDLQATKTNHFALKWSAPESLRAFEYGKPTDVWAFGVLVMECVHRGDPYPGIPDEMVAIRVREHGFHPQLTVDTPDALADLLERCWRMRGSERVSFVEIRQELAALNGIE